MTYWRDDARKFLAKAENGEERQRREKKTIAERRNDKAVAQGYESFADKKAQRKAQRKTIAEWRDERAQAMGYENLAAKKEADRAARLARIEARNKPGKKAKVFSPSNTSISETDVQTTNVITGGASATGGTSTAGSSADVNVPITNRTGVIPNPPVVTESPQPVITETPIEVNRTGKFVPIPDPALRRNFGNSESTPQEFQAVPSDRLGNENPISGGTGVEFMPGGKKGMEVMAKKYRSRVRGY